MENTTYSFAEIAFVAQSQPGLEWVAQLLSMPSVGDEVRAAGLSSLLMRGLARFDQGQLVVANVTVGLVEKLFRPSLVVSIMKGDPSGLNASIALLPDDGQPTLLVSLKGPGVYDLTPLKPCDDALEQLRDLAMAIAEQENTALTVSHLADASGLFIARGEQGWRVGPVEAEGVDQLPVLQRDEVVRALDSSLRSWRHGVLPKG